MASPRDEQEKPEAPKCLACAQKNGVRRFHHHWILDQRGNLFSHLLEQYGPEYETDGRLRRRLEIVREAARINHSVEAIKNNWDFADAYIEALKRFGRVKSSIKSGTELSAPKEEA